MDPRISSSLASILVLFIAIQPFAAVGSRSLKSANPSLTSFRSLEGTLQGQTKQGIREVKRYLTAFGYLDYEAENDVALLDDKFDEALESALASYQEFYRLKVTGMLDASTVKQMSLPRCGVPDSVRRKHVKGNATKPDELLTVPHYTFQPHMPKWPPSKTHLTYAIHPIPQDVSPELLRGACWRAFQRWSHVTAFTFEEASPGKPSDIVVGFYSGDHEDGYPFDGSGKILAHAFGPPDGRFHYDADEQWSINPSSTQFDLETVAVHEIGHLLGLGHSADPKAVMYPVIPWGSVRRALQQDDIDGIHALYREQRKGHGLRLS